MPNNYSHPTIANHIFNTYNNVITYLKTTIIIAMTNNISINYIRQTISNNILKNNSHITISTNKNECMHPNHSLIGYISLCYLTYFIFSLSQCFKIFFKTHWLVAGYKNIFNDRKVIGSKRHSGFRNFYFISQI